MKISVDDKVRVIATNEYNIPIGTIAYVIDFTEKENGYTYYVIQIEDKHYVVPQSCIGAEVSELSYKVGDRVIISDFNGKYSNRVSVIVELTEYPRGYVLENSPGIRWYENEIELY